MLPFLTASLIAMAPPAAGELPAAMEAISLGTLPGAPPGSESRAFDIDDGTVVGWADDGSCQRPFVYDLNTADSAMVALGPSGACGYAVDIDDGVVTGQFWLPGWSTSHGFAYDLKASTPDLIDLGVLPGGWSSEAKATDGGLVVGTSTANGDTSQAFVYDVRAPAPAMVPLPFPAGAIASLGKDVEGGIAAVDIDFGWTVRAFAYDVTVTPPTMVDLGLLSDGSFSQAIAVDDGIVTGLAGLTTPLSQPAFAYDLDDPPMRNLGTLGGSFAEPVAVDDRVVVGTSATAGSQRAFMYDLDAGTGMEDLGVLPGMTYGYATAIDGSIVVGSSEDVFHASGFAVDISAAGRPLLELTPMPGDVYAMPTAVDGGFAVGASAEPADWPPIVQQAVVWPLGELTATALSVAPNPVEAGGAVTFTATVSPAPSGGTVGFFDGDVPVPGCTAVAVDGAGGATCTTTFTIVGERTITARYTGVVMVFAPSVSDPVTVAVVRPTLTSLLSSGSPSTAGAAVTYTATVWPSLDEGTVAFTIDGNPISGCTARLMVDGKAWCTVTHSAAGTFEIGATYSGSAGNGASTANPIVQQVMQPTVTAIATSAANPSIVGATVTYTATVTPMSGGGTVSGGTVAFSDDGIVLTGCNARPVNVSTGQATCSVAHSTAGEHTIGAAYSGHGVFASSSTDAPYVQNVRYDLVTLSPTKAIRSGGSLALKLQLRNAVGVNLSSASIPVQIVSFSPEPNGAPSGYFSVTRDRKLGDVYSLTVKSTRGWPKASPYTLTVRVAGDLYEVTFTIT